MKWTALFCLLLFALPLSLFSCGGDSKDDKDDDADDDDDGGTEPDDMIWTKEVIDPEGEDGSIVVDSQDVVHVAYHNNSGGLKYAVRGESGWEASFLDEDPIMGEQASMVIDSGDHLHIVYYGSNKLYYINNVSGAWSEPEICGATGFNGNAVLALDPQGNAHVVILGLDNSTFEYTTNETGEWKAAILTITSNAHSTYDFAIDGSGGEHIFYRNMVDRNMNYAYRSSTDTSFENEVIFQTQSVEYIDAASMDVSPSGDAHLAYYYYSKDENIPWMIYEYSNGNDWTKVDMDKNVVMSLSSSTVLDAEGYVHFAYTYWETGMVKYNTNRYGDWKDRRVDEDEYAGMNNDLAVDSSGFAHICYDNIHQNVLQYATNLE